MASVVVQESNDPPRLSLSVDHPASSSPFPSPGSPFIPPPRLGAHEFALRASPTAALHNSMRNLTIQQRSHDGDSDPPAIEDEPTPTTTTTAGIPSIVSPPDTPMPGAVQAHPAAPAATRLEVLDSPRISIPEPEQAQLSPVASRRESLISSRPAPPSPAPSRRASTALSRHSSLARSRRQSKSLAPEPSSSAPPRKRRSLLVKIRDYAFGTDDERHVGRGPDVPPPNRPRRNRASTASHSSASSSASSAGDEDAHDEGEEQRGSWGAFRWNTLSSRFSWGGQRTDGEGAAGGPSRTDFERNFDVSSPTEESPERYEDDEDEDEDEQGALAHEDAPLLPGMYKALYAFEPEGTAEMALEEDQVVRVVGRGGGVGWAIVVTEEGTHALVPESYLELVQLDEDPEATADV